jgi:CDP-diacylglycerol--serine O-phosphatidyltransferase
MLRWVMLGLGMLMISNVQYAAVPTVGLRTIRGILGTLLVLGTLIGVIFLPKQFFFPALMAYVLYGIGRTVLLGLLDRLPAPVDDDDTPALVGDGVSAASAPRRRRRRRPDSRSTTGRDGDRTDSPS